VNERQIEFGEIRRGEFSGRYSPWSCLDLTAHLRIVQQAQKPPLESIALFAFLIVAY